LSTSDILRLMPMASALAYRYSKGHNLEEYRAVANLSLCEAVSSFDATKGAKIDSWAYTRLCVALRLHRQKAKSLLSYPDTAKGRESVVEADQMVEIKEWHLSSEDFSISDEAEGILEYAKALLTPKEYKVIHYRYATEDKLTQEQVGKLMGVSSSTVSKLEKIALGKILGEIFYYG